MTLEFWGVILTSGAFGVILWIVKRIDSSRVVPFEEANRPNEPYVFDDGLNNDVIVSEIDEEKHSTHDITILKDPQIYNNIGYAVRHADKKKISSKNEDGVIQKFKFDKLLPRIDHPAKETKENLSLIVAVEYRKDGHNHVVTYYDKPGGTLW